MPLLKNSRPSRARGLKHHLRRSGFRLVFFASITGAWIETLRLVSSGSRDEFASITGAWIETLDAGDLASRAIFASITGAWIETGQLGLSYCACVFASITGAWIETSKTPSIMMGFFSRPSRARGLKLCRPIPPIYRTIRVHHGRVD